MLSTSSSRLIVVTGLLTFALLALPASGYAATTIGSDLSGAPVDNACPMAACTIFGFQNPAPLPQASPLDGVIVRWRLSAGSVNNGDVALRVITADALFSASAHGTSETRVSAPGINVFPTRLPIKVGDSIAIDNATAGIFLAPGIGTNAHRWLTPLVDGAPPRAPDNPGTDILLLNADVEPDADHDGYGDETQDLCPTDASTQGACPGTTPDTTPDTTPPTLSTTSKTAKLSKRGAVSFVMTSNETATGTATGTIRLSTTTKVIRFKTSKLSFTAQKPAKITLVLSKKSAALVRTALKKRALKVELTVSVKDAAGNSATKKRTLKLKR